MRRVDSQSAVTATPPPHILPLWRFLSPYMAEPHEASTLHEKQGKHGWQLKHDPDALQAQSESAAK